MDNNELRVIDPTSSVGAGQIDVYRPGYHFTPPEGWMNDPNGLVYFAGEYHLFYQYRWPRHWGHAVSSDLIHWTHLPIGLSPDDIGDIWSGNAVVDWRDTSGFFDGAAGLVAIFTHWKHGAQHQSIAYSKDNGRTWTKYAGNPVIQNPGFENFRDPKVFWHEPTARWVMVVAAGDRVQFYTSFNLRAWEYADEFFHPFLAQQGVHECPDLFELPVDGVQATTRWVLQISIGGPISWRAYHLIGHFDGQRFRPDDLTQPTPTDYGLDSFAHASWSDVTHHDGRRVWIGWMNNWLYAKRVPTTPWQGALTIPRELDLVSGPGGIRLRQQPAASLEQLRQSPLRLTNTPIPPGAPLRPVVRGVQLEISAVFRLGTAGSFGLDVRVGAGQRTTIGYTVATQTLFVDRTQSGDSSFADGFACRMEAPLAPEQDLVRLRVLIDHCSVEVFGNDGQVVITSLVFPDRTSDAIEIFAHDGTVDLLMLDVYQLAAAPSMSPTSPGAPASALEGRLAVEDEEPREHKA